MTHSLQTVAEFSGPLDMVWRSRRQAGRLGAALALAMSSVLVCGCPSGGLVNAGPAPTISECPEQDVVVGESVTLTIEISEGMILGVATTGTSVDADVVVTRVDDQTFTATVTPTGEGYIELNFTADSDTKLTSTTLSCAFTAITHLGACCESLLCEVTDENECYFRDGLFQGHATTCDPNPCYGACCGLEPGGNSCAEIPPADCEADGGDYQGGGTSCASDCLCETAADCPDDDDSCTNTVCEGGSCGHRSVCAGGTPCDVVSHECPIQITVDFPASLANGESADLTINWTGQDSHFRKTGQFFERFGSCPEGFSCPRKTLTLENANPFVIVEAFTCRIDGATEPVEFFYEATITDWEGVGSNIATVEFTCVP